jgi:hypothetical protein
MSKKKNTLQDLDEFLKQQAASLVIPEPVSAKAQTTIQPTDYSKKEEGAREMTTDIIYNDLYKLAELDPDSFRQKLYALIVQILEAQATSLPEDKMLINTALYLKSGEHWKEAIRDYWRKNG